MGEIWIATPAEHLRDVLAEKIYVNVWAGQTHDDTCVTEEDARGIADALMPVVEQALAEQREAIAGAIRAERLMYSDPRTRVAFDTAASVADTYGEGT